MVTSYDLINIEQVWIIEANYLYKFSLEFEFSQKRIIEKLLLLMNEMQVQLKLWKS